VIGHSVVLEDVTEIPEFGNDVVGDVIHKQSYCTSCPAQATGFCPSLGKLKLVHSFPTSQK
jgi:hypothetical protein